MADVFIFKGEDGRSLAFKAMEAVKAEEAIPTRSKVLIKPNITAFKPSFSGVTTDPSIIEGIVEFLRGHGASDIVIGEGGGCDVSRAFEEFGFADIARRHHARLADFNRDEEVIVNVPYGRVLKSIGVAKTVLECSRIVNVPKLKVHCGESMVTLSMKNMMGVIARNRGIMHESFDLKIIDLLSVVKPHINIIDGIIGMEGHEIMGSPVKMGLVIASRDFVAADAIAAAIMGFEEGEVPHIRLAGEVGYGVWELGRINVVGPSIDSVRRRFRRSW